MVKKAILIICLFLTSYGIKSQEKEEIQQTINTLKAKIATSIKAEKLKWLDSLANMTRVSTEHNYDSIAKVTINHALNIDLSLIHI